jgi:NitT/TauT family transport system substrate-binding protein
LLAGIAGTSIAAASVIRARASETVRIGFPISDHYAPVYIAKEKGYFPEAGLQVDFKNFVAGGPVVEGLASRSMDIGFLGTPGLIAVGRKFPITSIMGIAQEGSGLIVKRGGIEKVEQLADKAVGLPARGSIAHLLLLRALTNANVDPARVRIVEISDPEGLRLGLLRGEIDAAAIWEPWVSQYEQSSELRRLIISQELWPGHQCDLMWVSNPYLKQRPEVVKTVIDVILKGMRTIEQDPKGAAEMLARTLKVPLEIEPQSMGRQKFSHVLQQQNIADQYALLAKVGILKPDDIPSWDRLVDAEMYAYASQRWEAMKKAG